MIVRSTAWLFPTPLTCPPCWPFLFSGLDMGLFLVFLVFPLFGVLCLNKVWHGLITWLNRVPQGTYPNETRKNPWSQTTNPKVAVHISQLYLQGSSLDRIFPLLKDGQFQCKGRPWYQGSTPWNWGRSPRSGCTALWHQGLQRTLWQT